MQAELADLPGLNMVFTQPIEMRLNEMVSGIRTDLGIKIYGDDFESPSVINRDWSKRRIVVQTNVRGRDLGGFVEEARERIELDIFMPDGSYTRFTGQFEHLERASRRLTIIVPIVVALIFVLLYLSIGTVRDALIVLTGVPFALVGGTAALSVRGLDITISAAVGFIAVSGVAMLSGLVLVASIRQRIAEGMSVNDAIERTRLIRLRPILMTGLVASLGFVPMAINTGIGAEIQRPLATVVIGGIIADNVLTLFMLPAMYSLFGSRTVSVEDSTGA